MASPGVRCPIQNVGAPYTAEKAKISVAVWATQTVHTYPGRLVRMEKCFRGQYPFLVVGRLTHFRTGCRKFVTLYLSKQVGDDDCGPGVVARTTMTDGQWVRTTARRDRRLADRWTFVPRPHDSRVGNRRLPKRTYRGTLTMRAHGLAPTTGRIRTFGTEILCYQMNFEL